MQLENRVIFITGATRGIGLAIGKRAAKDKAKIFTQSLYCSIQALSPDRLYLTLKNKIV